MIKKILNKLNNELIDIRFAASSLAFSTILSIIPFFIVVLAVFKSIGGLEELYPQIESLLLTYLKEATGTTVTKYIRNSLQTVNASTLGFSGAGLLLFASLGLIRNIDIAFNKIWKIQIKEPGYKRMWLHWIILLSAPVVLAVFAGVKSINLINQIDKTLDHKLLFFIWGVLILSVLYYIFPNTKVKFRAAFISAIIAGVGLSVVQDSFFWISYKLFKNNKIYGSLVSFPIFLIWLLIMWYVVLMGVALCAFLQKKINKEQTTQ